MADSESDRTTQAAATTERFRAAVETGDVDEFISTLTPDAVLHSPITARGRFHGHEQIRNLMPVVLSTIEDIRYEEDVGNDRVRALSYHARVGDQDVHEATFVRLDDSARVREIFLFIRPLPGLTAVTAGIAPKLARRHGRLRWLLVAGLMKPLAVITRLGDRLAVRLVPLDPFPRSRR